MFALQRRDLRLACARRDHHRYGIAGHDPEKNENDNRDSRKGHERHKKTSEDRKRDHRFVMASPIERKGEAPHARLGCDDRMRAQVAGDTSVGCKAPDLFGMTLRSDL